MVGVRTILNQFHELQSLEYKKSYGSHWPAGAASSKLYIIVAYNQIFLSSTAFMSINYVIHINY